MHVGLFPVNPPSMYIHNNQRSLIQGPFLRTSRHNKSGEGLSQGCPPSECVLGNELLGRIFKSEDLYFWGGS